MSSLWLSFTDSTDRRPLDQTARTFLESWLTARQIDEVLAVLGQLVRQAVEHADRGGEVILSRHDDTLLIEVVAGHGVRSRQAFPALGYKSGTHRTSAGILFWVQMPLGDPL